MYKGSIQSDWQSTAEGQSIMQLFYNAKSSGRKLFGILEQPAVHAVIEEVRYKVVLLGKSGVGKTWTVSRLAGVAGNNGTSYQTFETVGIRITNIYWPVKIRDKIVLFKLTVWDPGSHSFKKYTHIPVTCQEKADMQIIFFSYNDASSFNDLLPLINKCGKKEEDNSPGLLIIGTRHLSKTEVSKSEVQEFQMKHNVQIMTLPAATSGSNELSKVSPILNTICEQLWYRDQQYIMNQNVNL